MPEAFTVFFAASAGASATLLGLLFVAIAVDPERVFGGAATAERRAVAQAAYTALVDVFFLSLVALIPDVNVGGVALVLALAALVGTALSQGRRLWAERRWARGTTLAVSGLLVYGLQLWYALALLADPTEASSVYATVYLMLFVYGIGLARAWELLGAPRGGSVGRLLSRDEPAPDDETASDEAPPPRPGRAGADDRDP